MIDIIGNIVLSTPVRKAYYEATLASLKQNMPKDANYNIYINSNEHNYQKINIHGQHMIDAMNKTTNAYYLNFEEDHFCIETNKDKIKNLLLQCITHNVDVCKITFNHIEKECASHIPSSETLFENDIVKIFKMTPENFKRFKTTYDRYYIGTNSIFKKRFAKRIFARKQAQKPHEYEIRYYDKEYEYICAIPKFELLRSIDDDHGLENSCLLKSPTPEFTKLFDINNTQAKPIPYVPQPKQQKPMDINEIDDQKFGMEANNQEEADFFFNQLKPHHVVLEWGSGASSASIAKRVKHVYCIEHSLAFCKRIENSMPENSTLYPVPPNMEEGPGEDGNYEQYQNYINKAIEISKEKNIKFDVIFIDGRARVECAKICSKIAHKDTLVFIHDYNHPDPKYTRKEYFEAEKYLQRIDGEHTMWQFKVREGKYDEAFIFGEKYSSTFKKNDFNPVNTKFGYHSLKESTTGSNSIAIGYSALNTSGLKNSADESKGCTFGKTLKEKNEFYQSLLSFLHKNDVFFDEQFNDLQPHEKLEFVKYAYNTHVA